MRTLILTLVVKSDSHVHVRVEMKNTPFLIYCSNDSSTENRTQN